ncbi:Elongator complex protein 4 [Astathelohania contejeani]|uniref:Elongator complex protein 4 n=1 Tax=Astathelohania contejeani TaxID=164912 RepID=A0ABQ7I151_9MICR|nr:Elongator complex protein 4 [Thelohania contejeani]
MNAFENNEIYQRLSHNKNDKIQIGIPFLDNILGIKKGSMILIEEDKYSNYHTIIQKTFISSGLINNETVIAITKENCEIEIPDLKIRKETKREPMSIAWRYSKCESEHNEIFDMSRKMDLRNKKYCLIDKLDLSTIRNSNPDRIAIFSYLSPLWTENEDLWELKKMVRKSEAVCVVSIPRFLHDDLHHINTYFDVIINFNSYDFQFYPNYNGILEIKKIITLNDMRVNTLNTMKYGFKLYKYGFKIESIELLEDIKPVEDGIASISLESNKKIEDMF